MLIKNEAKEENTAQTLTGIRKELQRHNELQKQIIEQLERIANNTGMII